MLDLIYPIGSIYMSINNTNPTNLFGGTWQQLTETFLFAASAIGSNNPTYSVDNTKSTAQDGEVEHTLTIDEIPSHYHDANGAYSGVNSDGYLVMRSVTNSYVADYTTVTNTKGGGQAHNNMPPYLVVYMWKRIA